MYSIVSTLNTTINKYILNIGLDKVEGAAPKWDPEGGPMTVESVFASYKEQRLWNKYIKYLPKH